MAGVLYSPTPALKPSGDPWPSSRTARLSWSVTTGHSRSSLAGCCPMETMTPTSEGLGPGGFLLVLQEDCRGMCRSRAVLALSLAARLSLKQGIAAR